MAPTSRDMRNRPKTPPSPYSTSPPAETPPADSGTETEPPTRQRTLSSWEIRELAVSQLRRYLVEIIAFTLSADFNLLQEALGPANEERGEYTSTSILASNERESLLKLAMTVQQLLKAATKNRWNQEDRWNFVPDSQIKLVLAEAYKPTRSISYSCDMSYVLDMIAGYAK